MMRVEDWVYTPEILGRTCRIDNGIPGQVTGISYGLGGPIEIRVVWWDGRQRRCEWLISDEVTLESSNAMRQFGFDPGVA